MTVCLFAFRPGDQHSPVALSTMASLRALLLGGLTVAPLGRGASSYAPQNKSPARYPPRAPPPLSFTLRRIRPVNLSRSLEEKAAML